MITVGLCFLFGCLGYYFGSRHESRKYDIKVGDSVFLEKALEIKVKNEEEKSRFNLKNLDAGVHTVRYVNSKRGTICLEGSSLWLKDIWVSKLENVDYRKLDKFYKNIEKD